MDDRIDDPLIQSLLAGEGTDSPETLQLLVRVLEQMTARSQVAESQPIAVRATILSERLDARATPQILDSLHLLGRVLRIRADYAAAEAVLTRTLAARVAIGLDERTADTAEELGLVFVSSARPHEAEPQCRLAVDIRMRRLGENHEKTTLGLQTLARVLASNGRNIEALDCADRVSLYWLRHEGPTGLQWARALEFEARVLEQLGARAAAAECRRRASAILAPPGSEGPRFVSHADSIPRVRIEYEIETNGVTKTIELPFVVGVMADLSGVPASPLAPIEAREFVDITAESFDSCMAATEPRVAFTLSDGVPGVSPVEVDLTFRCLADFLPAAIVRRVPPLADLLDKRRRLAALVASRTQESVSALTGEPAFTTIDNTLSAHVNAILHHPAFQRLEAAWRGLHYLVSHTETSELMKIRVLNISKLELGKVLKRFKGHAHWKLSPIFVSVCDAYTRPAGEPFGCLVGDYDFDHGPRDMETLTEMARIASAAHAPFLSSVSPAVFHMSTWEELPDPHDLVKVLAAPEYAAWRSFGESEDARYVGLTLPRFLSRVPFGATAVDEFTFREDATEATHGHYAWANSAYLLATNITRSFTRFGWCTRFAGVGSGGAVEDVPTHAFQANFGAELKGPTEVSIGDRRALELDHLCLIPVRRLHGTAQAVFTRAASLQKPANYLEAEATTSAHLAARLTTLLPICRFVHYVRCIARDAGHRFTNRLDLERCLNAWIRQYVQDDPTNSSETAKARRPLAAAEISLTETEESSDVYFVRCFLRSSYQVEGPVVRLRLMCWVPSVVNDPAAMP